MMRLCLRCRVPIAPQVRSSRHNPEYCGTCFTFVFKVSRESVNANGNMDYQRRKLLADLEDSIKHLKRTK